MQFILDRSLGGLNQLLQFIHNFFIERNSSYFFLSVSAVLNGSNQKMAMLKMLPRLFD